MRKIWITATCVICFQSEICNAATAFATITGNVNNGFASIGLLNNTSTDVSGLPFTLIYTISDDYPDINRLLNRHSFHLFGGSAFNTSLPITASLNINGVTKTFGSEIGEVNTQGAFYVYRSRFLYLTVSGEGFGINGAGEESANISIPLPLDLSTNFDIFNSTRTFTSPENTTNLPEIFQQFARGNAGPKDYYDLKLKAFTLTFRGDILAYGAVPEPTVWTTMLAGFGFVGSAIRRRSKMSVAA